MSKLTILGASRLWAVLWLIALAAPYAYAVHLADDGVGQTLLFPYYTANDGRQTLLSIRPNRGFKALKLRMYEGRNARLVFSANIYLLGFDGWVSTVYADDNNPNTPASLVTNDQSCLITDSVDVDPDPKFARYRFSNAAYTGSNIDDGPQSLDRTRSGYIEVTVMADTRIPVGTSCDTLARSFNANGSFGSQTLGTSAADFVNPVSGVFGEASIVNVADGTQIGYRATALAKYRVQAMHTAPGALSPNLSDADPESIVQFDEGVQSFRWNSGADAAASTLVAHGISAEFSVERSLNAHSEIVLTFPTARVRTAAMPLRPDAPCVEFSYSAYDREGALTNRSPPASSTTPNPRLCGAVVVLQIKESTTELYIPQISSASSPVFAAQNSVLLGTGSAGLLQLRLSGWNRPSLNTAAPAMVGFPALGFVSTRIENNAARPGVIGYYESSLPIRRKRRCGSSGALGADTTECAPVP
jgi:hypothetical protein